ncbi:MAG TPA: hypothetical protein VJ828_16970 [Lacipirellulaceae bacterium]|nr:hypothetical protein [Lacipirellulaceae bacterium]
MKTLRTIAAQSPLFREKKSAENRLRLRLALLILTFAAFQCFASRSAALPVVENTAQYTDRFLPTLPNPLIPPGDNLQIFAVIETTDPPGSPTIAVTAKQGDTILTLDRFETPTTPPNFYWKFIDFDPSLTGAWEIIPTDSTGTGPSAFTDALAEPELLPFVESITPQGSPLGASVEWTLPDLTGFDVESVQVRIVQVTPRSEVFVVDFLPVDTTSFEPPSGVLQYGVEYVYNVGLYDVEGANTENRSVAQSQPFRYALPGDFNADGTVDAADYVAWRKTDNPQAGYDEWRANFGASLGLGSGSALPSAAPLSAAVPEPASVSLLIMAAAIARRKTRRVTLAVRAARSV